MPRRTAAVLLALLAALQAWSLSPAQKQGRDIYRWGRVQGEPVAAQMQGSELPAARFPCMACHGYRGQGTVEGNVRIPPIHRLALSSKRDGWNLPRTPYTDELVGRAITGGLNASGRPLHRAMPRYRMTAVQLRALLAYLAILNTDEDLDSGVTSSSVLFGAALPITGAAAEVGAATRSRIEQVFSRVNASGGVFGRRLELLTVDVGSTGPEEAMAKLLADEPFALLGNVESGDPGERERIRREGVPLVGPLGFSSGDPRDREYLFYFVPTLTDQVRTLALYMASERRWRRPALIHSCAPRETAAVDGVWNSAFVSRLSYERGAFVAEAAGAFVRQRVADAVLFLGSGADLRALMARLATDGLSPAVLTPSLEVEDMGRWVAPAFQGEVYLAAPVREGQLPMSAILGEAAAETAVEALKRAGRLLSRPGFVLAVSGMRDAEGGAYAGVPLPPGFQVRPRGAYVVRLDPASGRFSAVTGWLTPPH